MIAALMALVVVTNGGSVSVQENLTDHDCAEARSVVLWGESLEAHDAWVKKADEQEAKDFADLQADAAKWYAAHPKAEDDHCFSTGIGCTRIRRSGTVDGGWSSEVASIEQPGDPKVAVCVQ